MQILLAPNAFKGCMSARQAAQAMGNGLLRALPDLQLCYAPLADGGDGFTQVLVEALDGSYHTFEVQNALGELIEARIGWINQSTAIIDVASASGLAQLDEFQPLHASTYGSGQLLKHALDMGCQEIILGLGGSATTDGGSGLLRALGLELLDPYGKEVPLGGGFLCEVADIRTEKLHPRLQEVRIFLACDVENPLLGPTGTAAIYAPQKGASESEVEFLEYNLGCWANLSEMLCERDMRALPGGGAAGGTAAGLWCWIGAQPCPGSALVMQAIGMEEKLLASDIVITAEGRMDAQTLHHGKGPAALAQMAFKKRKPIIGLAGQLPPDASIFSDLFTAVFSIAHGPNNLEESIELAPQQLEDCCFQLGSLLKRFTQKDN